MSEPKTREREEAEKFINELREQKLSMMEIFGIVEQNAESKLKSINPKCFLVKERIHEEDLYKNLRSKLEEKKKLTNYPNPKSEEDRQIHKDIETLESAIYDSMQVPLFKIGLVENLDKGFEWLIDEILLSHARFDRHVSKGSGSSDNLFPAEKVYETSETAKEFDEFLECEREDYKIYAIEFIKKLCGK